MIDRKRLLETFSDLIHIDSPSKNERRVADYISGIFSRKAIVHEDGAASRIGGNTGNLIVTLTGSSHRGPSLIFMAHMDTVTPTAGQKPSCSGGRFKADGKSVLGADDKAGVAALIECGRALIEGGLPFRTVQLVFTVAEEIGLQGAKHLDFRKLSGQFACVLDSTMRVGAVIAQAPSLRKIHIEVRGKAAHSGIEPEKGINALSAAARVLSRIPVGRLAGGTTANMGIISGGAATNIVPDRVTVEGEVRSLDERRALTQARRIGAVCKAAARATRTRISFKQYEEFKAFDLRRSPVVSCLRRAAKGIGISPAVVSSCGGSDANVLNQHGIPSVVLGLGIDGAHTPHESIRAADIVKIAELVIEIVRQTEEKGIR
ncbi:MAG TPA: M20/M25/M40 family metallo-hydrolase [bacterium]|nr:M20/M25/M40 family metallo-hydrolase [bacterium]